MGMVEQISSPAMQAMTPSCSKGEAAGDRVTDFEGANAANGDSLQFVGYGAGATLTHLSGDDWQINYTGGTEVIKLTGITSLSSGDYQFV